jgi:lipopolysaccharide/colanic/teichoic acid biosynthesis glycosyltransferase
MVEEAASNGFKPAHENDSRVTRVGRFLRPWHLDELPQLINVLRGEMSFVGPRPFVPEWEEQLEKAIPFYPLRHVVKPGLTGWAQINRGYCETVEDNREKLEFDLFYIKNMSWTFDLWIIFQTVKIVLFNQGVR